MAVVTALEGLLDDALWYHLDVARDVLYIRFVSESRTEAVGEETDDGFILLRDPQTDRPIGLTIVNWWKRFGHGVLPDRITDIQKQIEPLAARLAA